MTITKVNCPVSKYGVKCPNTITPTRVVVHNTANDASAMSEISYMLGNPNECSFHYAVDDYRVVQGVEENRNTWNAGDGHGKGNMQGISVEICYSKSGGSRFTAAEQNGAKFVAYLLKKHGWGMAQVTKHQDYNGKYCPHRTLDLGWERFLNMVRTELGQAPTRTASSSSGSATIKTIQQRLNSLHIASLTVDGISGTKTQAAIKSFQGICGLIADGVWGAKTEAAYQDIAARLTLRVGSNGTAVRYVQSRIGATADGSFGSKTQAAVQLWQRRNGLASDGVIGSNSWAKMLG